LYCLKHQKEKRSMDHFAGLDVSVKETSVCIVDETGKIVREVKVASEPEALLSVLKNPAYRFKRIGLEAGPLSQWLFSALAEAELPVVERVRRFLARRQGARARQSSIHVRCDSSRTRRSVPPISVIGGQVCCDAPYSSHSTMW
jgi:hypothetical protein